MKCLSVRQPWAWAIIHAGKTVENRCWPTSYRGPLLIHAGKGCTRAEYEVAAKEITRIAGLAVPPLEALARGAIIGRATLWDCHDLDTDDPWAYEGQGWWFLKDPRACVPMPLRGRLGLWDVPDSLVAGAFACRLR